jgi:hypothetical protein
VSMCSSLWFKITTITNGGGETGQDNTGLS